MGSSFGVFLLLYPIFSCLATVISMENPKKMMLKYVQEGLKMNKNIKTRLIAWAIPLAVGGLATFLSGGMDTYMVLNQPPLSPPAWVFPLVWTVLYLLMGEASWRIYTSDKDPAEVKKALIAYGVQLFLNFIWPLVFFGRKMYLAAFVVLIGLWAAIAVTMRRFSKINERAADLLIPYLLWVTFAAYLNLGVFLLN